MKFYTLCNIFSCISLSFRIVSTNTLIISFALFLFKLYKVTNIKAHKIKKNMYHVKKYTTT